MSEPFNEQAQAEIGWSYVMHEVTTRHRAVRDVAQWFTFHHLDGLPKDVSALCATLAADVLHAIPVDDPELTRGLSALLQAKDHFVRAAIASQRQAAGQ